MCPLPICCLREDSRLCTALTVPRDSPWLNVGLTCFIEQKARDLYMNGDQFVSMMILGALLLPTVFAVLPLFCLHIWLAFTNMTTIEMSQYDRFKRAMRISGSPARLKVRLFLPLGSALLNSFSFIQRLRYPFDHGAKLNMKSFFGASILGMFVPGEAPGDGMAWPVREDFIAVVDIHEKHMKEVQQRAEQKRAKSQKQKQKEPESSDSSEEDHSVDDIESHKKRVRGNAELARLV